LLSFSLRVFLSSFLSPFLPSSYRTSIFKIPYSLFLYQKGKENNQQSFLTRFVSAGYVQHFAW